jgi:hypothetical protein
MRCRDSSLGTAVVGHGAQGLAKHPDTERPSSRGAYNRHSSVRRVLRHRRVEGSHAHGAKTAYLTREEEICLLALSRSKAVHAL